MAAVAALAIGVVVIVAAAQLFGDDSTPSAAGTNRDSAGTTETTLDQSPFCVAIRALDRLGSRPAGGDGTAAQVLEQNREFVGLIADAIASAPSDAPKDVGAFLADNRTLSAAIEASAGDKQAAIAALTASDAELLARVGRADAHAEAFAFFSDRCGTAPPP